MNEYAHMASQLQSRVSKRAAKITASEMWVHGFRYLKRYKDVRETKEELKELRASQKLDKALLQLAHGASAEWEFFANARPAPNGCGYHYVDGDWWEIIDGN